MRQILVMAVFSLYFGFASSGVDNAAHTGGLAAGFLLAVFVITGGKRSEIQCLYPVRFEPSDCSVRLNDLAGDRKPKSRSCGLVSNEGIEYIFYLAVCHSASRCHGRKYRCRQ